MLRTSQGSQLTRLPVPTLMHLHNGTESSDDAVVVVFPTMLR